MAATVVGIIAFLIVMGVFGMMSIIGMVASSEATKSVADTSVLVLNLSGTINEQGEEDITISKLMKIAHKYGVSAEELMYAEAPRMKSYFVVRKGQGMSVERTKAYKYQSLVSGYVNHKADVFIVTVEPKPEAHTVYKNNHAGQEFNLVLEGAMDIYLDGKTIRLNEGDSIYFDSSKPHGMLAVGDKAVRFLAAAIG